jgi:hypothetical protein
MYSRANGLNWLGLSLLLMAVMSTLGMEDKKSPQHKLSKGVISIDSKGVISSDKARVLKALNKGASANGKHSSSKEPILVVAAKHSSLEVVEILAKQQGIDPKTRVKALKWALIYERYKEAKVLIETFPQDQINTKDDLGATMLHYLAEDGHKGLVKILLERGADPIVFNRSYMTPAEVASRYSEVKELINSYDRWLIVREAIVREAYAEALWEALWNITLRSASAADHIAKELKTIQELLNAKPMLATLLLSVIAILIICSLPSSK